MSDRKATNPAHEPKCLTGLDSRADDRSDGSHPLKLLLIGVSSPKGSRQRLQVVERPTTEWAVSGGQPDKGSRVKVLSHM